MADTPIPVDEGSPEATAAPVAKRNRNPLSASTNDDGGIKSESEESYHQAKKPRTAKPRHPRGVPWFTMLERLKQYKVKHGTFNVPRILADDQKLASWVHYQRYLFHHKTIAEERKAALDALGFEWTIADSKVGNRVSWDEHLVRLQAYKERFGDCLVPYTYKDDKSLAYWVSRQRKDNNKGLLPADKVAKLNAIGFAWNPTLGRRWSKSKEQRSRTTNWEGQFEKLKALLELSANSTELRSLIEQDKSLEAWMKNQRYLYSVKRMAADRVERLESINFVWRIGISWNDYLVRLKNHKDTTGSFEKIDDPKLAEWRDCQRIAYSFKELKKDKVDQLNAIGFVWESDKVVASQEEWKSVMQNEDAALLASIPQSTVTPALVRPQPKPMLYANTPTALDEKLPALSGQGVTSEPSPEEMAKFLEEHVILDVSQAGAAQRAAMPDTADANMQEYNIAIHLAGLAETTEQPQQQNGTAPGDEQKKLPAAAMDNAVAQQETQLISNFKVETPEGATGDQQGEELAVGSRLEEGILSTQEKLILLQDEIVALREEKVKLQEERVKVQQDKGQLRFEIEEIQRKNQTLINPEDTAESCSAQSRKKELEDQVNANEQQLTTQAALIKEREVQIQKLSAEAAGERTYVDEATV